MLKNVAALILCIATLTLGQSNNFQYATRFPQNKLYNLSPSSTGLDGIDGTVAAFGDFNNDKFTDLFVLGADQRSLSVYTWHHQNFTFIAPSKTPQIIENDFIITGVVPGDFNYDGKLDVLLMGQKDLQNSSDPEILLRIYRGNGNDTFESTYIDVPSAKEKHPMVLDLTGDMKLDLLGYPDEGGSGLSMWINTVDGEHLNATSIYNRTSAKTILDENETNQCLWAHPHSNAVVDLNGDCLADLVFVCQRTGYQSLQIWTNERDEGFKKARGLNLPTGAGPISYADIDGDGTMDIIFPVIQGSRQQIHIVYNQQMDLCSKQDNNANCRKAQNLCIADPDFKFDMNSPDSNGYVIFDLKGYIDSGESIQTQDPDFKGVWPIAVHPGDYNLDGYPDLLVTTNNKVLLLDSTLCSNQLCTSGATMASRRTFSVVRQGAEALSKIPNPRQAVFFDIDEDGSLDMLILSKTSRQSDANRTPNFIINNFFNDAFFLKGLVSNGVCGSNCPAESGYAKPYGVNYPGATFKYTVLDTSGTKRVHQVSQLSQSSYLSLQTPYCLIGLGRTNNYVEEMFAGVSRHQDKNYLFYEGVIPNSQLIFIPYQPNDVQDSSTWKVELYIQPGDYVPWVLVVLIVAAIILGIVVAVLYWMEKREDEMERRKALHIINFDAL
ncbi:hypothetical protein INT45_005799 [Circinella minor]|uniref:T-cell immunomodulatory protein TIP C2 domain-containing protein n=1 Tax=Circinella minor TaxID=1195481 RepID=A0A8H7SCG1_9FUNG|nr:hypothetical protein INT45_005799 [Circinella minor]